MVARNDNEWARGLAAAVPGNEDGLTLYGIMAGLGLLEAREGYFSKSVPAARSGRTRAFVSATSADGVVNLYDCDRRRAVVKGGYFRAADPGFNWPDFFAL